MKKFLTKSFIFLFIATIAAYGLQNMIDNGLKRTFKGYYKEWNSIFQSKINSGIIIQGSSRAKNHVSPKVLDSVFDMNCYNLGMRGYEFGMQYYRLLLYLKNNKKPKYIIQIIDKSIFTKRPDLYEFEQFLPYLDDSIIKVAVTPFSGLDWRDIYIPMYKYRKNFDLAYTGIKNNFKTTKPDSVPYKGFLQHNNLWDSTFREFRKHNPYGYRILLDKEYVKLFENFLELCKKENITIIFVNTPEYIEAQKILINSDSIKKIFNKYSLKYNIPTLDYARDSICLDTVNFYNSQHMNTVGVAKFNKELSNDLKKIIK